LGRFTVYDESVDQQINQQLQRIVNVIVDRLGDNVESIILGGGFGRGEGSVKWVGDAVVPLKDFDFLIVTKKSLPPEVENSVEESVYSALGIQNSKKRIFRFSDFVVDLNFSTPSRLGEVLFPDVAAFEFKVASYLLYGRDVRGQVRCELRDIPLTSGWRLLFEKMTGLIGHFPGEYLLDGKMESRRQELLVYECEKTYIEIATALTILMGCYAPSFSTRDSLFRRHFAERLPELSSLMPELPASVAAATAFKMRPDFTSLPDPFDLWLNVRDDLLTVSRFYLAKLTGTDIRDFVASNVVRPLSMCYFHPISSSLTRRFALGNHLVLERFTDSALQLYLNVKYVSHSYSEKGRLPFRILMSPFTCVNLKLQTIAPRVLLSIDKNGEIDKRYFESAVHSMSEIVPGADLRSFDMLRKAYLETYKLLQLH